MTTGHERTLPSPLPEATLIELADEIRRLANRLSRDVRRQSVLPGLSQLSAMRPAQEMLAKQLGLMLHENGQPDSPADTSSFDRVGYL